MVANNQENTEKDSRLLACILAIIVIATVAIVFFAVSNSKSDKNIDDSIVYQKVSSESQKHGNQILSEMKKSKIGFTKELFDPAIPSLYNNHKITTTPIQDEYKDKVQVDFTVDDYNIYSATPNPDYDKILIYFYGGGYAFPIAKHNIQMAYQFAKKLNAKIYIPIYPLAPKATFDDGNKFMDKVYEKISSTSKNIIFMGDSSGGNFATIYSQYLYNKKASKLPSARILISPWVDLSMSNNEILEIEKREPLLARYGLSICGQMWAGDCSTKDPKVSSLYGETEDKIKTIFFCSENDILTPDAKLLYKKLKNNGCKVKFILAQGLFHAYMDFVDFPETQEGEQMAINFIEE